MPLTKLRSPLILDVMALYGLQFSNFLIPVLTLPILTRVLPPKDWASLLIAQSVGLAATTVIEYGHNLTTTRAIALADQGVIEDIVKLTLLSKILLIVFMVIMMALVMYSGEYVQSMSLSLLFGGFVFGILQGSIPIWYFQGVGRARFAAVIDMSFKIIFAIVVVVGVSIIKTPESAIWLQTSGIFFSWLTLNIFLLKSVHLNYKISSWPKFKYVVQDLKKAFQVFVFRFIGTSYTSALALLLALVIKPSEVALILAADRITKILPVLGVPLCQALYPRFSSLGGVYSIKNFNRVAVLAGVGGILVLVGSISIFFLKSVIVGILVGTQYRFVEKIISYTVWLMPFFILNTVLMQLWVFPTGKDKLANLVLVINLILTLIWIFIAYSKFSLEYYAMGIYSAEIIVFIILLSYFIFHRSKARNII